MKWFREILKKKRKTRQESFEETLKNGLDEIERRGYTLRHDRVDEIVKKITEDPKVTEYYEDKAKRKEWENNMIVNTLGFEYGIKLEECEALGREYIEKELSKVVNRKRHNELEKELCTTEDLVEGVHVYYLDGEYWSIRKYMEYVSIKDSDGNQAFDEDGRMQMKELGCIISVSVKGNVIGEVPDPQENALNDKVEEYIKLYKSLYCSTGVERKLTRAYLSYLYANHKDSLTINTYEERNGILCIKEVSGNVILDGHILYFNAHKIFESPHYKVELENKRKANNLERVENE